MFGFCHQSEPNAGINETQKQVSKHAIAIEAVANANTNFGNALFKILAKPAKNLIMSSYSVSLVLNMALNGAEGTTASQLKQGLTLKDFDVVKNGFKVVLTLSRGATGAARAPKTGKAPLMAARRHCRRRLLFFQNRGKT